jgi:DNA-binding CsgD family transcriptional regulator
VTRVELVHRAIRHVYEAAISPDGWSCALDEVAHVMSAQHASLVAQDTGAPALTVFTGLEPVHALALQREFETRLPRWISAIPPGTPRRQTSEIADADFRRTPIYNEVVKPAGMCYGLVAPLVCMPGRQIHFSAGRDLGLADFSDEDVEAAKLIVPHLTNAVLTRSRLAVAELRAKGAYAALAHLAFGVILLDARMRAIHLNPRAERLVTSGYGLTLIHNALNASLPEETKQLRAAMASAIAMTAAGRDAEHAALRRAASQVCCVSRRPPLRPLVIHVVPVDGMDRVEGVSAATRVILFVIDPDLTPGIDPMVLIEGFGFTRREAALAALLVRGLDLAVAATQLGISLGTARGYLKLIFLKTDTHRQTELVSLLLRSGSGLRNGDDAKKRR